MDIGGKCVGGQKIMPLQMNLLQSLDAQTEAIRVLTVMVEDQSKTLASVLKERNGRLKDACWSLYQAAERCSYGCDAELLDLVRGGCIVGVQIRE